MKIKLSSTESYMISFDHNPEALSRLHDLGYSTVTRMPAYRYGHGKFGLGMANYNVFKHHLQHEFTPFILFEDDVDSFNYIDEIDVPDDADAVYLGLLFGPRLTKLEYQELDGYQNDVYRIYNPMGTHAILYLTERYAIAAQKQASLVARRLETADVDYAYVMINKDFNIYAINPVFCQNNPAAPLISNASRIISIAGEVRDPIF